MKGSERISAAAREVLYMALMRLDKFMAHVGAASRREAREIIRSGRVSVDGAAVRNPERKFNPEKSAVVFDGRPLHWSRFHYYMMDKPAGVLTATEDARQKTVLDLLPPELRRMGLFPVGRLDRDTSGLLLLTDDGDFTHRVISPGGGVEKLYYARVDGPLTAEDARAFTEGLVLRDGTRCKSAELEITGPGECLVTVREGKYHQVKRMLASRGAPVTELRRLRIGALELDAALGPGGFRELEAWETEEIFSSAKSSLS